MPVWTGEPVVRRTTWDTSKAFLYKSRQLGCLAVSGLGCTSHACKMEALNGYKDVERGNLGKDEGKSEEKKDYTHQRSLSIKTPKNLFKDTFCISLRFAFPQD